MAARGRRDREGVLSGGAAHHAAAAALGSIVRHDGRREPAGADRAGSRHQGRADSVFLQRPGGRPATVRPHRIGTLYGGQVRRRSLDHKKQEVAKVKSSVFALIVLVALTGNATGQPAVPGAGLAAEGEGRWADAL